MGCKPLSARWQPSSVSRTAQGRRAFLNDIEDRFAAARLKYDRGACLMDIDRLQQIETAQEGQRFILRTPATGDVGQVFQAVGIALPPNIHEAQAIASTP
jgi:hypothetical protein